eukprot:82901_1
MITFESKVGKRRRLTRILVGIALLLSTRCVLVIGLDGDDGKDVRPAFNENFVWKPQTGAGLQGKSVTIKFATYFRMGEDVKVYVVPNAGLTALKIKVYE